MKNKILWLDLAVCSVWTLAVCGSCKPMVVALFVVAMRLTFSFAMARHEQRAWLPLALTFVGLAFLFYLGCDGGLQAMAVYPFYIFNLDLSVMACRVIRLLTFTWILLLPMVAYIVCLCRRRLTRTDLRWRDLLGGILWRDRRACSYSAMMLIAIAALFCGLAMDARLCLLMCLAAPSLTYLLLCRHYGAACRKVWVIVIGMFVFYRAELTAGAVRMVLLLVSFAAVVYVCTLLFKATKSHALAVCAMLYIGALLPSLCVGYNQYACLNYARPGYYPCPPYHGVFHICDASGRLVGLRDRYKILLEPEYESIKSSYGGTDFKGAMFDVRQNGRTMVYDAAENLFIEEGTIDGTLQAEVCDAIKRYYGKDGGKYADRCEVVVSEMATGNELAHVKTSVNGRPYYVYDDEPFLPADSAALRAGVFVRDTLSSEFYRKEVLGYALDVPEDSTARCRIVVKLAEDEFPKKEDVEGIAKEIAKGKFFKLFGK